MLNWINNRFAANLEEIDLYHVKNFSLIWNVFEDAVCNRNCSIPVMEAAYQNINFDIEHFRKFLDYFQSRYETKGNINQRFPALRIGQNNEPRVTEVLEGRSADTREIVLAISIIVYRYRNNLFHGEKEMRTINLQEENFRHANGFLQSLLENYYPV